MGMRSSTKRSSGVPPVRVSVGGPAVMDGPDGSTVSDDFLVEHARTRDVAAFDALLARHRPTNANPSPKP